MESNKIQWSEWMPIKEAAEKIGCCDTHVRNLIAGIAKRTNGWIAESRPVESGEDFGGCRKVCRIANTIRNPQVIEGEPAPVPTPAPQPPNPSAALAMELLLGGVSIEQMSREMGVSKAQVEALLRGEEENRIAQKLFSNFAKSLLARKASASPKHSKQVELKLVELSAAKRERDKLRQQEPIEEEGEMTPTGLMERIGWYSSSGAPHRLVCGVLIRIYELKEGDYWRKAYNYVETNGHEERRIILTKAFVDEFLGSWADKLSKGEDEFWIGNMKTGRAHVYTRVALDRKGAAK